MNTAFKGAIVGLTTGEKEVLRRVGLLLDGGKEESARKRRRGKLTRLR